MHGRAAHPEARHRERRLGAVAAETRVAVERLDVSAYEVPTDEPESDATAEWDSTTIVVVEAHAGGKTGLGYTYAPAAAGKLIEEKLADGVEGAEALSPAATWEKLATALRNAGRPGLGFCALAAVDTALWDLKARLLELPLVDALPRVHDAVLIYGSGGFCSYSLERLREQLAGWVEAGIPRVKIKISREPERDAERLDTACEAINDLVELYVDSNGAFGAKEALGWAERLRRDWGVRWYEEPVSSADLDGLRLVRERGPRGLEIAAGEYAYVLADFRNLIGAVDCLQADVTRCGGFTGLLQAAGLARAHGLDLSAHCAPQLSAHGFCAVPNARHIEYFHDHVRIEPLLFDGVLAPVEGTLRPDRSQPGHGLELKHADAERYAV
jgi:L-alanine-DL-glutamate epimerase-like enolase superfamily enzyme